MLVLGAAALVLTIDAWTALGARAEGVRLARMERSPRYGGGKFRNTLPVVEPEMWTATWRFVAGVPHSRPDGTVPIRRLRRGDFARAPSSGLRVTWFGHSSVLVEIDGRRVLTDPVWGDRVSPSSFVGPSRFHPPPIDLASLPALDAVVISHDHYDHLDMPTIVALEARAPRYFVPLGVGAHLESWGVPAHRIEELDWWDERRVGPLRLVATPARHFSGRSLTDRDATLWAGWAIVGPRHRVFFSGDTGMFPGFAEIGRRLGPFDVCLVESGAYDAMWADVHVGPEQAIDAHRALRGDVFFPVHWGTFDLSLHSWTEPIERLRVAARRAGVKLVSPRPGEPVDPASPPPVRAWWPSVPWRTASQAPVVSSGLSPRR